MSRRTAPRQAGLSRRGFLGIASLAVGGLWVPFARAAGPGRLLRGEDRSALGPLEREHHPILRVPVETANGAKVPVVVELDHPMTPEHHVTLVEVRNARDPVPSKGTFHFTPESGRAYVAFQTRIHHGVSEVVATAECNRHGRWSTARAIRIPDEGGG